MAVSDAEINGTIQAYVSRYPQEAARLQPLLRAMRDPAKKLRDRSLQAPGHVTASALVVNPQGQVLYLLDDKRQRWLLPGGHVDIDDKSLADAARREVFEETGIPAAALTPLEGFPVGQALDIGVRKSRGSKKRGEDSHLHFDLRYPMAVAPGQDVHQLLEHQAACYRWMPPPAAPPVRLAAKLSTLLPLGAA